MTRTQIRESAAELEELSEFLRIPSISADSKRAGDLDRAAHWVASFIESAGGNARVTATNGPPLVVGEVKASTSRASLEAPTVMIYGHYDVQPPGDESAWESPPFEPTLRDGWLYARGAADDKGNFYVLLKGLQQLALSGTLPVNVTIVSDGEEEIAGTSVVSYLRGEVDRPDACVIFDGPMPRTGQPALTIGTRGLVFFHLELVTGTKDLHSGLFGGVALNAAHALVATLAAASKRVSELQVGVVPASESDVRSWALLDDGAALIRDQGGNPSDSAAARDFYLRTWALPSVDVHGIRCGEADRLMTVIPSRATANVSVRLVPNQSPEELMGIFVKILSSSAPPGAVLNIECMSMTPPVLMDERAAALELAKDAFECVFGLRPVTLRCGGSLAILTGLAEKEIPTVLSGLDVPEGNIHAPNERFRVDYIEKGIQVTKEILTRFAHLPHLAH